MNVLIFGKNQINNLIEKTLNDKGYNSIVVEDVTRLKRFSGQIGDFTATLDTGEVNVDFVILTEQPHTIPTDIDGAKIYSLYEEDKRSYLAKSDRSLPLVFLLDYYCESPAAATLRALEDAKQFANSKRKVYILDRFIRTAGLDNEQLYKDTRNSGVTFIKYEDIDISYDENTYSFTIKVSDGVLETEIITKTIFADGGRDVGPIFRKITKTLNLWPNETGYLLEDRYFLVPVLTSRRGIFHIPRDMGKNQLNDGMDFILASIKNYNNTDINNDVVAEIDEKKCVFCYSCLRACPHGAMEPNKDARVMKNLNKACEGCGICVSVCPGNAIVLSGGDCNFKLKEKHNKTLVICCENSAALAMEQVLPQIGELASLIDVKPVSCGGQIGIVDLSSSLNFYDKVMIAVCMDDACKHFDGNKRACRQSEYAVKTLKRAGFKDENIGYVQVSHIMTNILRDSLIEFMRGEKA